MPPRLNPPTHPIPPYPPFSYLSRTPLWFGVLLTPGTSLPPANQPTNQPAKSFSDVAPTDKWSALGLPACGHYWSMRFSVFLQSFSRHFFYPSFFFTILRSTPLSVVSPMLMPYLPSIPHACVYILFYVMPLYYLSHFPRIPIRS